MPNPYKEELLSISRQVADRLNTLKINDPDGWVLVSINIKYSSVVISDDALNALSDKAVQDITERLKVLLKRALDNEDCRTLKGWDWGLQPD